MASMKGSLGSLLDLPFLGFVDGLLLCLVRLKREKLQKEYIFVKQTYVVVEFGFCIWGWRIKSVVCLNT